MCDFLVSTGQYNSDVLAQMAVKPYLFNPPRAYQFDCKWGSCTVLEERKRNNVLLVNDTLFAFVGDLVLSDTQRDMIISAVRGLLKLKDLPANLCADQSFKAVNGLFAILIANNDGLCILTDPLGLTQVYAGFDKDHHLSAIGTQGDIVAAVSSENYDLDMVSLGEFLNRGAACFPYTMHSNVRKLYQGSCNTWQAAGAKLGELKSMLYWKPPAEQSPALFDDYVEEFKSTFAQAVNARASGNRIVVTLSGGLDSRLLLASIPRESDCIAFTFCDQLNREASIAYKVAKVYNQPWLPIYRDEEYIGRSIKQNVLFAGCECDWIHGHAAALSGSILSRGIDTVLSGYLMDTFLRGYFAKDIIKRKRCHGLLAPAIENIQYDWINMLNSFCTEYLSRDLANQMFARRRSYFETRADASRGSVAEWLDTYPFSQRPESGTWMVERRMLPLRIAAADRRLLDFSFKCPAILRANGSVFNKAILSMLGAGAHIPNANNGIRPASNSIKKIIERSCRRIADESMELAARLGCRRCVQHSWHDYQQYWQNSSYIKHLVEDCRPHLSQIEGLLFNEKLSPLAKAGQLHWRAGFRLLAIGIWKSALTKYKTELILDRTLKRQANSASILNSQNTNTPIAISVKTPATGFQPNQPG